VIHISFCCRQPEVWTWRFLALTRIPSHTSPLQSWWYQIARLNFGSSFTFFFVFVLGNYDCVQGRVPVYQICCSIYYLASRTTLWAPGDSLSRPSGYCCLFHSTIAFLVTEAFGLAHLWLALYPEATLGNPDPPDSWSCHTYLSAPKGTRHRSAGPSSSLSSGLSTASSFGLISSSSRPAYYCRCCHCFPGSEYRKVFFGVSLSHRRFSWEMVNFWRASLTVIFLRLFISRSAHPFSCSSTVFYSTWSW